MKRLKTELIGVGPAAGVAAELLGGPLIGGQVLLGSPGIAGADVVAADAGGLVDAGVSGEDDLGAGPAIAVSGLLVKPVDQAAVHKVYRRPT